MLRDTQRAGAAVEAAFRAVPRHVFLREMAPEQAYQDQAFVIKHSPAGLPLSSSSQPAIMAIMLEQLGLAPGQRVLEIGTGTGYNAALMAHIVGDQESVVTVDIDEELVARARASLDAAGYPWVQVSCGDGGLGVAEHAPYDRVIVTVGAWDLAPQWLAQLAPGGRIVLPLSIRGIQLSVALERAGDHWTSRSACRCGFIRMAGAFAGPESFLPVGPQPGLYAQADDGRLVDTSALHAALSGQVTDVPTELRAASGEELGDLDLWLTMTEPRLTRLTVIGMEPRRARDAPLMPLGGLAGGRGAAGEPGVAALMPAWGQPRTGPGGKSSSQSAEPPWPGQSATSRPREQPEPGPLGIMVRGYGPGGADLASYLAQRALHWDHLERPGSADLRLRAYPHGYAAQEAAGDVILDRDHVRLVLDWAGHDAHARMRAPRDPMV
jgi:protein-L-isoaspartate(D-aspartate) O-methyltransferase